MMTTPDMEEVVERLLATLEADRLPECSFDDGRSWEVDDVGVAEAFSESAKLLRALLSERRKMVEALTRQTDNMAFVLNRVELPPAWLEKFDRELDEARAALTGSKERD